MGQRRPPDHMLRFSRPLEMPLLTLPLLLLLLLATGPTAGHTAHGSLCDGSEFRSILADIDHPPCLAEGGKQNCSLMRHFEHLAKEAGMPLDYIMSRVSVLVFAHSDFIKELVVPHNPVLGMVSELERHYAFIGVTKCLKASNSTCQRLRLACLGGYASQFVFMLSGHCSKSWGCSTIHNSDSQPITLLNMLQYIQFRIIERQVFVAKELGELQLSTSVSTEYLIQTELNDTYGSQLTRSDSKPLAVFVTGPAKTLAYYQQLYWFLEAALSLKDLFAFHVVSTPLSKIDSDSERPMFRWKVPDHQSFLALYTKELCDSKPTWVFSCKPQIALGNSLLFGEQYTSFLLHTALVGANASPGSHSIVRTPNEYLRTLLHTSTSYVLAVMPVDELLTDPNINREVMKSLVPYLSASFGINYHPVVITKATALQTLVDLHTGLDLEQTFYRPCFFIRLPNGAHAVLKIEEPIAILDKTLRESAKEGNYEVILHSAREMFNNNYLTELPTKLIQTGHIVGDVSTGDDEVRELVDEARIKNRTDAFVEQSNFKGVYDVTGVLVVESDPKLMRDFLEKAGQDRPWLVLFTVSWSPLCKAARAVWSSVGGCAQRMGFPDVQLVKVDCFEANEICQTLKITSYPTIAMFTRGIQLSIYSGPIVSGDLCLYVKLAFEPPVLTSSSEKETKEVLDKVLSIKSRAFVLQGSEVPSHVAALAKSLRFREVFIHEKSAAAKATLRGVYSDVSPSVSQYLGSVDDASKLLDFVENGHLKSVFPCTWTYLPQALKLEHPLVMLFHLDTKDSDAAAVLQHLHAKFGDRAAFCHMNLRNFTHLNELVNRLAGLSLPAMVALTKPPAAGSKITHRLPLGALPASELTARTADWLEQALGHRLPGGRPVEPGDEKWQPASKAFNFVDQVYHGRAAPEADDDGYQRMRSSRVFSVDSADGDMMYGGVGGPEASEYTGSGTMASRVGKAADEPPTMSTMRDEL